MAPSDIDYLHMVDFTKGFKRIHVKWSVGDISTTTAKTSETFATEIGTTSGTTLLSWSLSIEKKSEHYCFGLLTQSNDKVTPVQFRIFLSSQDNVIYNFEPSFYVFSFGSGVGWGRTLSLSDYERIVGIKDIICHCLIDIPTSLFPDLVSRKRKLDENNDKTCKHQLGDYVNKLFTTDNKFSDVAIVVKKNEHILKSFPCHRVILASKSSVFERMFVCKEWTETECKDDGGRSVEIKDIDEKTMETILSYIYTSAMPDESTDQVSIFSIIYAADKYDLTELKNWCVSVLISKHRNRWDRVAQLKTADMHHLHQLKAFCLAYFSMDFIGAFGDSALWKDLPENLIPEISADASKRLLGTTEILVMNK